MPDLKTSPLHDRHVALGAKMADFGGWDMPIEYPGGGVVAEHSAVRERVGIFDVSHLGKASVVGPSAVDFVNAGLEVTNRHDAYGIIAVQGPKSDEVVRALGLPTEHDYMGFAVADWDGRSVIVCRTGYTGERGYELVPRWEDTVALWDALTKAMAPYDGLPCGLGARDTLRTEMGYPLHGQDLSLDITPVQARAGWAVGWKKPEFWGREALLAEKEAGAPRQSWGLLVTGRGIPRQHCAVLVDGRTVGEVTSGTFSPTLRQGIALALLEPALGLGAEVTIDVRGREVPATVVKPPFVQVQTRQA
jgi:aminomethyltransferase